MGEEGRGVMAPVARLQDGCGIALWVQIDQEDAESALGRGPGEAEGHGCLAYAALEAQNADGDHETSVCRA